MDFVVFLPAYKTTTDAQVQITARSSSSWCSLPPHSLKVEPTETQTRCQYNEIPVIVVFLPPSSKIWKNQHKRTHTKASHYYSPAPCCSRFTPCKMNKITQTPLPIEIHVVIFLPTSNGRTAFAALQSLPLISCSRTLRRHFTSLHSLQVAHREHEFPLPTDNPRLSHSPSLYKLNTTNATLSH